jgi:Zn-dependent alcohol dehydrogenase
LLDGRTRLSREGQPVHHYCGLAAFAEHTIVAESACVPMPERVPFEIGAVIGCAVATGVGAVVNTANVTPGNSVAVFGLGGVGLSCVMGAVAAGASRIFAIDTEAAKLTMAVDLGATHPLPASDGVVKTIRGETSGRGADFVFEAVGIPGVQRQCVDAARPGGTVVFSGLTPVGVDTAMSASALTRQEKAILGSYYGSCDPVVDFPRFAQMYLDGRLPLNDLIRRTYSLEQINEAYADLVRGQPGRGVVLFG